MQVKRANLTFKQKKGLMWKHRPETETYTYNLKLKTRLKGKQFI